MKTKYRPGTFITVPSKYRIKEIDAIGQSVYMWLSDHANSAGLCFPSINRLAKLCKVTKNTIKDRIRKLEKLGLVRKQLRKKNNKENQSNLYQVVEDNWMPTDKGRSAHDQPGSPSDRGVDQQMAGNSNHSELNPQDQSIYMPLPPRKTATIDYLENISESDVMEIAEKYGVSREFVRDNVENVTLHCASVGKEYKNYKATLIRFIKINKERMWEKEHAGKPKGIFKSYHSKYAGIGDK
ncbi:MAG: helix-turn-helix domain-containing protein [Candidatus Buchananbacteria bacterium]